MFSKLSSLWNIKRIDGSLVYTKDNLVKVVYKIESVALEKRDNAFENFLHLVDDEVQIIVLKEPLRLEDCVEYFSGLLGAGSSKAITSEASRFVSNFSLRINSFYKYQLYFILTVKEDLPMMWQDIFQPLGIELTILDKEGIISFFDKIFSFDDQKSR